MSLDARVRAILDAGIDAAVFERCAVELMSDQYKKVVPVEGGSDGGRDGDIYGPIADDPDSRGRILVTTGELLDNLKSSHETWKAIRAAGESFRVDQLVMVTHKPVSDTKRRNVIEYCSKHALPTPEFWTRDWLVGALRRRPDLRVALTGIEGRLEALAEVVPSGAEEPELVGRADAIAEIKIALAGSGDVSIVGLPGVGKTRLLGELNEPIHLVEPLARTHLTDDLLEMQPSMVAVDDAHLDPVLLEELVRIRDRERLHFKIVTISWPGTDGDVEALLNTATHIHLERLARGELDQLIKRMGVSGHRARQLILDQSDGRAGWATVLVRVLVDGRGEELVSGQFLLDQVSALARSIAGTAKLHDALACIAALRSASMEDLEVIAEVTGLGYADLVSWLEVTAQGGLVARTGDSWTVFPALRPLLVAAWFFGDRKVRNWATFGARFGHEKRLVRTLLEMAAAVPGREGADLADAWLDDLEANGVIDVDAIELLAVYAHISGTAADRAAGIARRVLAEPRRPETPILGSVVDPTGDAAVRVLHAAFRRTCSREALHGLLDVAISDPRPRHSRLDHPMQVVKELAQHLDPDAGPISELRELILGDALRWFDDDPSEDRWTLLAEVVRYVLDPETEGTWLDPGSHTTFTMARAIEPAPVVGRLVQLWAEIDSRVRSNVGRALTHVAVAHFCGVFETWATLSTGGPNDGVNVTTEHRTHALDGAERVQSTLAFLADRFPAVPLRVNGHLSLVKRWSDGPSGLTDLAITDARLARFAPARDVRDDMENGMEHRRAEVAELAAEVASLGVEAGIAEFERLVTEAALLDGHHDGEWFATLMSREVAYPGAWLRLVVKRAVRPLFGPMLSAARAEGVDVADVVAEALGRPDLRPLVIRVVVREDEDLDTVASSVVEQLVAEDSVLLDDLWTAASASPMLKRLLGHPVREVRAAAAVAFGEGIGHGPPLASDARAQWRSALLEAKPEQLPPHARWRLEQILDHAVEHDPELAADWFIASARAPVVAKRFIRRDAGLAKVLRDLPREQRRRIAEELDAEEVRRSGYLSDVLGHDEHLAAELLADGVVDTDLLLRSLSGYRDKTVEALAPVLLKAGASPDAIADRTLWRRDTVGSVAASIRGDIKLFAGLADRRPELRAVTDAATARLQPELTEAEAKERMDKLQGW
jgi:hypothetical protein